MFKRPLTYIVLLFLVRLVGITNPPLEVGHNWRQTTVMMVARNFYEGQFDLMHPRVDMAGELTGITGMEFPLLNALIALAGFVFGFDAGWGRLINLLVSSWGLWMFYRLVRCFHAERMAVFATVLLGTSIWFDFSRKIMPDTFAMSLMLGALYFGAAYLTTPATKRDGLKLAAFGVLLLAAGLTKLPVLYAVPLLGAIALAHEAHRKRLLHLAAVGAAVAFPIFGWYFVWVPHLNETYGYTHFFMGVGWMRGMHELAADLPNTLRQFYDAPLKYTGFIAALSGCLWAIKTNNRRVWIPATVLLMCFWVIMVKSGNNFPRHNYYVVPFAPVMAWLAAYGIGQIRNARFAIAVVAIVAIEGIANQQHEFFLRNDQAALIELEADLNAVVEPGARIAINSGLYPTPMYFAHRKGWICTNDELERLAFCDSLAALGCEAVVILKHRFGTSIDLPYERGKDTDEWTIYRLATIRAAEEKTKTGAHSPTGEEAPGEALSDSYLPSQFISAARN